jgi:hypothetical protein
MITANGGQAVVSCGACKVGSYCCNTSQVLIDRAWHLKLTYTTALCIGCFCCQGISLHRPNIGKPVRLPFASFLLQIQDGVLLFAFTCSPEKVRHHGVAVAKSEPVRFRRLIVGSFILLHVRFQNPLPYARSSRLVHNVRVKNTGWNPTLTNFLLESCYFRQTLRVLDELLDSGFLLVAQLDAWLLRGSVRQRCGVAERFVCACGENTLCCFCRCFMCAEDLLGLGALGILDLLVVQEADLRRKVQQPISVVLR